MTLDSVHLAECLKARARDGVFMMNIGATDTGGQVKVKTVGDNSQDGLEHDNEEPGVDQGLDWELDLDELGDDNALRCKEVSEEELDDFMTCSPVDANISATIGRNLKGVSPEHLSKI